MLVINDATDVIAADFEDMATGGNHPLSGVTPIVDNTWHMRPQHLMARPCVYIWMVSWKAAL